MRLHRLEIEGFGPFLDRQIVDFDGFADDGIFLIAGRTGAGKSSILDAVCFGLYGGVPRYESGDKRLRSDYCAPEDLSEVVVEFSTTAGRFRVTRSPEYQRPAKRGGGLTKQASAVALDEWIDDAWVGRAARAVDVGNELDEILQLSREQFLQVILLAQNRFARFLLADSKERQALLRRLFGTERFDDVQSRFDERRRAAENALAGRLATVSARVEEAERVVTAAALWGDLAVEGELAPAGSGSGGTEARLEALRLALTRAEYQAERRVAEQDDAEKRLAKADAALVAAREEKKAQQERDRARAALEALDAEEPQIVDARHALERARAAEALRATITATTRAQEALVGAAVAAQAARSSWSATGVDLAIGLVDLNAVDPDAVDPDETGASAAEPGAVAALETWASDRIRESGAWARAAEQEATIPALMAELAAAEREVTAASERFETGEAERLTLPSLVAELTTQRDDARRLADRVDDLALAVESARVRRDAVAEQERLSDELAAAERRLADASTALAAAQNDLADLRRRRLDGFAGELATALVEGEPCAVCGSTSHPAPAAHTDPVSADDIESAEAVRDASTRAERVAGEQVSAVRAERAAALARAEERTVETADAEVKAAAAAHADAITAAEALASVEARLTAANERISALDEERAESTRALAAAREALALIEQRSREIQALVADARGPFDTVAQRLAATTEQITAAQKLAEALAEHSRRAATLREAAAEQQSALAASDFDDATAVQQALHSSAEQAALDARITAHSAQRAKEKATLLDLELRTLCEEPIDLAPVEQSAADARSEWKTTVDAANRAQSTAEQLARLIESAAAEHGRSAEQQAEYEVIRSLADTIAGRAGNTHKMTLETFVLAAELEEIVQAANRRLSDMSTGRYQLQHSDALAARGAASGLGIVVFDAFTGQARPAQSLSGGETFLSSLALALGLAEVVTARAGGIQLDTLFIDEGFGSLDADTLDIAMRTLDELRSGGRTVGIISHVESMQEQIPAQLVVEQTESGPSRIRS
ncbi:SMC family ATPase [Microbacterium sp. AK031]|uniref:AAA family ATPase n=1 Tax=Microbacterium sp. AK031 TaxID=2723076 RepID=UPI002169E870|nr:SMC family ATPase [Microbacterium sp. AK031]MCS3843725.1 exonuclease SbcC [Microbacterium sp. AK031]